MKIMNEEKGQILVLVVLCMTVLLGFMALAIDVGLLFRARRNVQIAADAAAVAGGLDYKYNGSATSARTAGKAASAANGVTDGVSGAVVTINVPPVNGPYAGTTGFVEAIVTQPNPTFFMSLFHISSVSVDARAVVGAGSSGGCIWALALSGSDVS